MKPPVKSGPCDYGFEAVRDSSVKGPEAGEKNLAKNLAMSMGPGRLLFSLAELIHRPSFIDQTCQRPR
jgi:hypothetical protein